jgi:streptogramin lyase
MNCQCGSPCQISLAEPWHTPPGVLCRHSRRRTASPHAPRLAVVTLGLALAIVSAGAAEPGTFERLATYRGLGALVASGIGPGAQPGTERWYGSYLYIENTIDVVSVDPSNGEVKVFANPAKGESGARAMVTGPDGNIYLGTLPRAHVLKLDPKAGTLIDLGRPSETEEYIWELAVGSDKKLYGCTYPQARLVRYDPASGRKEDLGRMDPVEQYARHVAASDDGFVYTGIGTSRMNIGAYEIATGTHREILPSDSQTVGTAHPYRAADGVVYATAGKQHFRLKGWTAQPIAEADAPPAAPNNRLRDGRTVDAQGRALRLTDAAGKATSVPFDYPGNELPLFRVGFAPDGALYASAVLPIHLVRLDEKAHSFVEVADLGGGEVYSFLAHGDNLLMAAYSAYAPLMKFNPARPVASGGPAPNPVLVNYPESDSAWRPMALINGPGGKVYAGAIAGYGKLGGPLTVWDPATDRVAQHLNVIPGQSVQTLAAWKNLIFGGTTIGGGGGSHPTEKEARLFLWDPATRKVLYETAPVPAAKGLNDLVIGSDGMLYGIGGRTLFVFDPETRTVKDRQPLPFSSGIYNGAALGPDGRIWGLAADGVFAIDPATHQTTIVAKAPGRIYAGFALRGDSLYLVCGSTLYRYRLPSLPPARK